MSIISAFIRSVVSDRILVTVAENFGQELATLLFKIDRIWSNCLKEFFVPQHVVACLSVAGIISKFADYFENLHPIQILVDSYIKTKRGGRIKNIIHQHADQLLFNHKTHVANPI
jgi:hypothetical protein